MDSRKTHKKLGRQDFLARPKVLYRRYPGQFSEYILRDEGELKLIRVEETGFTNIGKIDFLGNTFGDIRALLLQVQGETKAQLDIIEMFLRDG